MKNWFLAPSENAASHSPLKWSVIAMAAMLSGCMGGGMGDVFGSVSKTDTTASIEANRQIPLEIAEPKVAGNTKPTAQQTEAVTRSLAAESAPISAETGVTEKAQEQKFAALALAESDQATLARPQDEVIAAPSDEELARLAAEKQRAEAAYARLDHGSCEGGWGPKPTFVNARREDPSHPYYLEMRLRHTPPLPVGHVYIAYGRRGADGKPIDEKLVMLAPVGGYAGATVAAAVPVTGVMKPYGDDCILKPIAAYYRTLSAADFEKLMLGIEKAHADKPRYALWNYNCNHFMSDVAQSVGILPPTNKYAHSLVYFYEMMDRNEGRKVARSPGESVETFKTAATEGR